MKIISAYKKAWALMIALRLLITCVATMDSVLNLLALCVAAKCPYNGNRCLACLGLFALARVAPRVLKAFAGFLDHLFGNGNFATLSIDQGGTVKGMLLN